MLYGACLQRLKSAFKGKLLILLSIFDRATIYTFSVPREQYGLNLKKLGITVALAILLSPREVHANWILRNHIKSLIEIHCTVPNY